MADKVITSLEAIIAINRQLNPPLNEAEWAYIESQGLLGDLRCGRIAIEGLAEKVRQMRSAFGGHPPQTRDKNGLPPDERCRALAQVVAQLVTEQTAFFRKQYLGGRFLSEIEMQDWIKEQAEKEGEPGWVVTFAVRELGDTVPIGPPRAVQRLGLRYSFEKPVIPICAGGVLDRLRQLAVKAAENYSITPADACRTILTGIPPVISPMHFTGSFLPLPAASRFHITVDPAVTPIELMRAYRDFRRKHLKARVRKLSRKHLQLAAFMASRPADEKGADAMKAWNRKFRRWKYTHVSNFLRDAAAAQRRLLFPGGLDYLERDGK